MPYNEKSGDIFTFINNGDNPNGFMRLESKSKFNIHYCRNKMVERTGLKF
jgi:hypothetical protein